MYRDISMTEADTQRDAHLWRAMHAACAIDVLINTKAALVCRFQRPDGEWYPVTRSEQISYSALINEVAGNFFESQSVDQLLLKQALRSIRNWSLLAKQHYLESTESLGCACEWCAKRTGTSALAR